ncbi:MAG: hypothetical protein U5R14_05930 [Gemmatimonadota bacterium]|nr:hypothetical protein [Gemmatimonadota bacterium]
MTEGPRDRFGQERPLDNVPPPLLTYGDEDEYEKEGKGGGPRSKRPVRVGIWIVVAVAIAGAGYFGVRALEEEGATDTSAAAVDPAPSGSASSEAGSRPSLGILGPPDTTVAPGSTVELAVSARDEDGGPLPDVRVRFEVDGGVGTLTAGEVWTDRMGIARTSLTMPSGAGEARVRATLDGADVVPRWFTVATQGGEPAAMAAVAGDAQEADAGGLLPERLAVQVQDPEGNPVPGVEVRFEVASGGGMAAPSRARTDSLGRASAIWRLGGEAGDQTLSATSPALPEPVTFTATAQAVATATPTPEAGGPPVPDSEAALEEAAPNAPSESVVVTPRDRSVGGSNVCAITNGSVTCRGANDRGQGIDGGVSGARAVSSGLFHACALDADGIARCWGANEAGQLGDGSRSDRASPVRVDTEFRFSTLAAGVAHTCGLTSEGRAACWGQNLGGQLGDGSRDDRTIPALVAGDTRFTTLVSGWNHTCGITAQREAFCWGLNREGQLGDGSRLDGLEPGRVIGSVDALAAGNAHTCAVSGGQVLCWGDNRAGQLGDGTTDSRVNPTPVSELPDDVVDIAAGAAHTCALLADGTAHCWGQNLHGQLGTGNTAPARSPTPVLGGLTFERIQAGGGVTCGTTVDGVDYCWGLNQSGQLGDGSVTNRAAPARVRGR